MTTSGLWIVLWSKKKKNLDGNKFPALITLTFSLAGLDMLFVRSLTVFSSEVLVRCFNIINPYRSVCKLEAFLMRGLICGAEDLLCSAHQNLLTLVSPVRLQVYFEESFARPLLVIFQVMLSSESIDTPSSVYVAF